LETRALAAFMPNLCKALLGTELELPSIATWWCGQPRELAHVTGNIDAMMVGNAFATGLAIDDPQTVLGAQLSDEGRASLLARLRESGADFVGQEPVRLSTAPVY